MVPILKQDYREFQGAKAKLIGLFKNLLLLSFQTYVSKRNLNRKHNCKGVPSQVQSIKIEASLEKFAWVYLMIAFKLEFGLSSLISSTMLDCEDASRIQEMV